MTQESMVAALAVAQDLAAAGIPVFAAPPAPGTKVGFRLPPRWEQTPPDPELVNQWQPGWALCLVCGHGLDGIDVDTYAGGDLSVLKAALGGILPEILGMAATASGGTHLLVRSLGVASKNALLPGIDVKAGTADGKGSGFLFIAPTVRVSKVTGRDGQYGWLPGGVNLERMAAAADDPGQTALAALIGDRRAHRGNRGTANGSGPANGNGAAPGNTLDSVSPDDFMRQGSTGPWKDIAKTLANGRNDGVMRLAAALRETTAFSLDEALDHMYAHVWPLVDQHQGGHGFPESEFEEVVAAVWRQYPGAADRIAASVAAAPPADTGLDEAPAGLPLPHSLLDLTETFLTRWVAWTLASAGGSIGGPYRWAPGLGWMRWRGTRWEPADTADIWNEVRQYFIYLLQAVSAAGGADQALLAKLVSLQSKAKVSAMTELARGHELIRCDAADFDSYPDLLNTPAGIVDLRTGEIRPHDPALLLTKITSGNYVPGYTHPDWDQALTALDGPEREWYQSRIGQAVTGHPPADGIMPVLQGAGANGKTLCSTDGPGKALGDYADMASHKLITSQKAGSSEHSTEMADLRGQRLLIGEELSEGRSIDVTALKRIMDVGRIKARYVHKDNITFDASHSLFCTTNYRPVINETDHGTWRRLALLVFSYTFRKPGEPLLTSQDKTGDPELKQRIRQNLSGQHDAIVTWAVQGAMRWYGRGQTAIPPTEKIEEDTLAWRAAADHVLGFWNEFLEADHGKPGDIHVPCIGGAHLQTVFNAWLGSNGHNPWTKQTFAARFAEHEMTTSNGVEYRQTRALGNLSFYTGKDLQVPVSPTAKAMWCWIGIRFKNMADLGEENQRHERHGCFDNSPTRGSMEVFPNIRDVRDVQPVLEGFLPASNLPEPPQSALKLDTRSSQKTLVFDLETASADELFTYTQRDETGYVRLAGVRGPTGTSMILTAPELVPLLEAADQVSGHNILGFDLLALARHCGADYTRLAAKALDTELVERQANPPRSRESGSSLDSYGLDATAQRLGVAGKTDDAKRLARKHGGWDKIPLDDTEYRSYLEGDLAASAAVLGAMERHYQYRSDPYVAREHALAAIAGQMTLNGLLVDTGLLAQRLAEGQAAKHEALQMLHDGWGLPLTKTVLRGRGEHKTATEQDVASPLSTDAGRAWLAEIWAQSGLEDPPRTAKAQKLSIGIDDLKAIRARRPDLAPLCALMAVVTGTRTVYQTAADCLASDGRVHPVVSMRQASGRWSVTNPGLTVFGKRGGRHHERDIFLPDPGHVLLSFDLSQVDMRAMGWLSQDHAYRALFAPGKDAHQEIADQVGVSRQDAKAIGHGWNYGLGRKRMIANGLDPGKVDKFIAGMEARFSRLIAWREEIRAQGAAGEILLNGFGRRMRADPARAYTVAPALMGQGGARDVMCESLLRLPRETWPMLRVMVHDEIVLSVPERDLRDVAVAVKQAMTWQLDDDLPVLCDMAAGRNWGEVSAK